MKQKNNDQQTLRMALPLSLRKLVLFLKSGIKHPINYMSPISRFFLQKPAGLNAIGIAANVKL